MECYAQTSVWARLGHRDEWNRIVETALCCTLSGVVSSCALYDAPRCTRPDQTGDSNPLYMVLYLSSRSIHAKVQMSGVCSSAANLHTEHGPQSLFQRPLVSRLSLVRLRPFEIAVEKATFTVATYVTSRGLRYGPHIPWFSYFGELSSERA